MCYRSRGGGYLSNNYKFYKKQNLVEGWTIRKKVPLTRGIIQFCRSRGISTAYASYWDAYPITFLSRGQPTVHEFYGFHIKGIAKKIRSFHDYNFAIIIHNEKFKKVYLEFLAKEKIQYKRAVFGHYVIYWAFTGWANPIKQLRYLIPFDWWDSNSGVGIERS